MPAAFGGPNESLVVRACSGRKARPGPSVDDVLKPQEPEKPTPKRGWFSWLGFLSKAPKAKGDDANKAAAAAARLMEALDAEAVPWHIVCWDRQTAALLHYIDLPVEYGRLTSFAWRPQTSWDQCMFVAGTIDGAVHVFTVDAAKPQEYDLEDAAADSAARTSTSLPRVDTSSSLGSAPAGITYAPTVRDPKISAARPRPYKQRSGSSAASPLSAYSYTSDLTLRDGDETKRENSWSG